MLRPVQSYLISAQFFGIIRRHHYPKKLRNGKTFGRKDLLFDGVSKTLRETSRYHLDSVEDHWQLSEGSKLTDF